MKILVINCGSSSLKYQLIDMEGEKVLCKGLCERIGMESSMITHEANGHKATTPAIFPTHTEAFTEVVKKMTTGEGKVIDSVSEIDAIGHRVVHGGEKFKESCLITPEVVKAIHDLSPLAPLHNPAAILGIEASYKVFGEDKPNVAVFDTAFHSTMPPKAYMYAIPYEYYEKYGVRRYGFHGTSHRYVSLRAAELLGKRPDFRRLLPQKQRVRRTGAEERKIIIRPVAERAGRVAPACQKRLVRRKHRKLPLQLFLRIAACRCVPLCQPRLHPAQFSI